MRSTFFNIEHQGNSYRVATRLRDTSDDLVVLMHGLGGAKEDFDGAFSAPDLDAYSLCALDWLGYGESDRPADTDFSYRLEDQAQIASQIIGRLRKSRVFIVGHSMGGGIGLLTTQRLECERLGGFIGLEGLLGGGAFSKRIAAQTREYFLSTGRQELISELRAHPRRSIQIWADEFEAGGPIGEYCSALSIVDAVKDDALFRIINELPEHRCYIHTSQDNIDELRPRLVGVEIKEIADAGHFMMRDNPEATYHAIGDCLVRWRAQ
jgi:pimeloyl-ACP methyl ester carboxylesterase